MSTPAPTTPAANTNSTFEWRAALGPWRWLILGTLGVTSSGCEEHRDSANAEHGAASVGGRPDAAPPSTASPTEVGGVGAVGASAEASGEASPATTAPPPSEPDASAVSPTAGGSTCVRDSALSGNWERCTSGMLHRPQAAACTSTLPRPRSLPPLFGPDSGITTSCSRDSDCADAANGHCDLGQLGPTCSYGCVADVDCAPNQVCLCGPDIGECVIAECRSDADCGPGSLCGSYQLNPTCGGTQLACQTPEDECTGDLDCAVNDYCTRALDASSDPPREAARRTCETSRCSVGRPFLIDGTERLAPSVARSDWYGGTTDGEGSVRRSEDVSQRGEDASDAVGRGWLEQALMEHASVAAFARFSLQLLQLGAPGDLVASAAEAMQDEIRHARACFDLARRYSRRDIGPGPLPIEGALERMDLASALLDTLREGCIGETVAALEASEAVQHCEDAATRAVLRRIAVEEGQHAELAWRFVAWVLETKPELVARVREAFAVELAGVPPRRERAPQNLTALDRELARHGLLSTPLRLALRQRVLAGVVAPCAEALLAGAGWRRPEEAAPTSTELAHPA